MDFYEERSAGFAVEHHRGNLRTLISEGVPALSPIATRLEANGEEGDLVVVKKGTGEIVMRWILMPGMSIPAQ